MEEEQLIYLNAINLIASAKIDALQKINQKFNGDFKKAWRMNLSAFMPKSDIPFEKNKSKIDPDKEYKKLESENVKIITMEEKDYPQILKEITDPPFAIYIQGNAECLNNSCIGIVGTRKISDYGKQAVGHFAPKLARAGLTIVSGLAKGVDASAHKSAIENNLPTIGVLGCGLGRNVFYPPQNWNLSRKIIETGGAVISEYPLNLKATSFSFPQRNRIISGLSMAVLIIEADIKSGSLITARSANEQNREVYCVPGNIFSITSKGTNEYIKKGARPVTDPEDILTDLGISYTNTNQNLVASNKIEEKLFEIIPKDIPIHIDEIIRISGFDTGLIQSTLIIMEMEDKIKNLGNDKYTSLK